MNLFPLAPSVAVQVFILAAVIIIPIIIMLAVLVPFIFKRKRF